MVPRLHALDGLHAVRDAKGGPDLTDVKKLTTTAWRRPEEWGLVDGAVGFAAYSLLHRFILYI